MEDLAQKFQVPLLETSSAEDWDSVERVFHAGIREGLLAQVQLVEEWTHIRGRANKKSDTHNQLFKF